MEGKRGAVPRRRPSGRAKAGWLCECRWRCTGPARRGRVSGEYRPAAAERVLTPVWRPCPGLFSLVRTGPREETREWLALSRCVGPAATRAPSTWGAAGGGGGGGSGEPGRARGGSAGSLRREEGLPDRDGGPGRGGQVRKGG